MALTLDRIVEIGKEQFGNLFHLRPTDAQFARAIEAAATAPLLARIAALTAQVEQAAQPVADPFTYVIQHLNSNPYALSKDECIEKIKELRARYNSQPKALPLPLVASENTEAAQRIAKCLAVLRPVVKNKFPQHQALEELVTYLPPITKQQGEY